MPAYAESPLLEGERVLVVGAHPDDETIGAGRLVAQHRGPTSAVTLTWGESCVPGLPPGPMGDRRIAEWRTAIGHLGCVEKDAPRWPDGRLDEHEDEVAAVLSDLAHGFDVLLTTWRHDPHPDHEAAGRAAAAAAAAVGARLVEFPVWAPYWTDDHLVGALGYEVQRLRTSPPAERARQRALATYVSQTRPLAPGIVEIVPQAMLERHPFQIVMAPR
ncbi:MAG: putative LmbE-like protein [Nocardioidaceae bacterium]|nr:putative LmbE-like protein [Nocardioidaceae bacterium]